MWHFIKRTVKDPHSPSVLKVQHVTNGEIKEYEIQEDVKNAIHQECKIQFSLAHAPIMTTLLGERLQYLSDEALARAIITGTYKIPSDMDPATNLILEENEKLGIKLINGEGTKIIITLEDFQQFWTKVGEFTSSSMSGIHYRHYKAAIKCNISTRILAQQLTVVARSRIPPESWSISLLVMLEKKHGSMTSRKARSYSAVQGRLQLLQPIHLREGINGLSQQHWLHAQRAFLPKREYKQRHKVRQDTHGRSFSTGPPPNDSGFSR
jgi:hypothetical protein